MNKINPKIVIVIATNVNEFRLSLLVCANKALVNVVFKRFKKIPDQLNLILSTRIHSAQDLPGIVQYSLEALFLSENVSTVCAERKVWYDV